MKAKPEVLAPAGDLESLRVAVAAGADAVYFGLKAWSARARATNVDDDDLAGALAHLHANGRRGYVALNTLVFDAELPSVEEAIRTAARVGVDALIVQDLGVAKLARAIAPDMPLHASTQMTCTDAGAVELARELGCSRVILARELSTDDIAAIRAATDVELEVFVHGALCIAYSGQCLTSEAIGGRSANRGACAQACRLPYDLVVDGEVHDTGERAYLLSPEDLEASEVVPRLAALGVASVKIEGRLKGPAYVAATTQLYRKAVDALEGPPPSLGDARHAAKLTFSRGSGPGFLAGVDHQRLVDGKACDHRGVPVGTSRSTRRDRGKTWIEVETTASIARGDGLLFEGGRESRGEIGGRVWALEVGGRDVESVPAKARVSVWLGPDRDARDVLVGRTVWKTNAPDAERAIVADAERHAAKVELAIELRGDVGAPLVALARSSDGRRVEASGATLEAARSSATSVEQLRDKLGRLGDTPYVLGDVVSSLGENAFVPPAELNRVRRALVEALDRAAHRSHATTSITAAAMLDAAAPPLLATEPGSPLLFVLCRTIEQARAAREAGADGVWLDFLELTGTGNAFRALRAEGPGFLGVAPPRIRKPGEEKIDRYLASLSPDGFLVRGLGALREASTQRDGAVRVGDASLNVANRLTAAEVLSRGVVAFTPSFDLDAAQLLALVRTPFGPFAEIVVHHPMPLFHMEHCVIAAELSTGKDHRDCGRPCEAHKISLRDRAGMEHPVEADVGCRNTVFHAAAQSAASVVGPAREAGVRRFRIELVRESATDTARIVRAYRELLLGRTSASDVRNALGAEARYGVVRGSLRVLDDRIQTGR